MSERGVFAVDRGIWDHPVFAREAFTEREAFMWLVSEASYRPRRFRTGSNVMELARGQLAHSLRFMADKWGWKEPRVRRFLGRLKIDAVIDADSDAGTTRITICNYDKYQRVSLPSDAANDAGADAQTTQQRRKEEDKKYKKDTLLCDPAAPGERDDRRNGHASTVTDAADPFEKPIATKPARKATNEDFERFRAAYPRRDGTDPKEPARKRFEAAVKSGANPELIIAGAKAFAAAEQKRGNVGSRFIPHGSVWLNRRGWEDHQAPPPAKFAAETESWRMPVESWCRDPSTWNSHAWGPAPGEPGCKVPEGLLTAMGEPHCQLQSA
ncbi:hypothetical protein [uncultured Bosea sp.]|uniref:hypothetical protein n=1 Tax=uncultured Bosea sp. TaxID=211457 RepID=UPI0025E71D73|nr:hypothetical protein [uncultured Bosea sp.]